MAAENKTARSLACGKPLKSRLDKKFVIIISEIRITLGERLAKINRYGTSIMLWERMEGTSKASLNGKWKQELLDNA